MTNPNSGPIERTDVAIIGAGPVGLFAIFECGMLKMNCHVIDGLDVVGGQCRALYPEKPIFDIPGYPEILAGDLVTNLESQAGPFAPVYHLGQQVVSLSELSRDGEGRLWRLETSTGQVIESRVVIVAAGVGAFGPKRPPIDRIETFERQGPGLGVHYMVGNREDFRGKKVVIAGGGDSAVDWALSLSEITKSLAIVHRRDKFRAAPGSAEKLRALQADGKLEIVTPYQLAGLEGNGALSAVVVQDLDGNAKVLEADALLAFYGLSQNLGPIAEWELNLEKNHISVDPATCATSKSGIFAVGDIATYPGKLKLILTGFAEAALAAHAAFGIVHPDEALHFEYSTTQGLPDEG